MSNQVDKLRDPDFVGKPLLSRGQLQQLEEDPTLMETFARLMGAVNLDNLFRQMQDPKINPSIKIEFQKMLNKMGRLEPDTKTEIGGTGPQVVINITRAKDHDDRMVIEGEATAIDA